MSPRAKYGLIVGGLCLVITAILPNWFILFPILGFIGGAVAANLASREEGGIPRTGSATGTITGALVLVGELIGEGINVSANWDEFMSTANGLQNQLIPLVEPQVSFWFLVLVALFVFGILSMLAAIGGGVMGAAITEKGLPAPANKPESQG